MKLTTAHRILITAAVAVFVLYALAELRNYFGGDPSALIRAGLAAAGSLGLAIYLRRFLARISEESPPSPPRV